MLRFYSTIVQLSLVRRQYNSPLGNISNFLQKGIIWCWEVIGLQRACVINTYRNTTFDKVIPTSPIKEFIWFGWIKRIKDIWI